MQLHILIIGNCQLSTLADNLRSHLGLEDFKIDFILSYQNLDPSSELKSLIESAHYIITQPIKNYAGLRLEDLREQARNCKQIIRVPFVRFHGFWERTERNLAKFSRECVMFFPHIEDIDAKEYLSAPVNWSQSDILSNYEASLKELGEIEKGSDIPFMHFFESFHRQVPLFRDPWHPSNPMSRFILNKTLEIALQVIGDLPASEDPKLLTKTPSTGKEFGHFRPITDFAASCIGLDYDLDSYYICSRLQYLFKILKHEHDSGSPVINTFEDLQRLLIGS